uniref:Aminotransferase-like plant mobile domain-containing protein n=2 Tax=Fagus sylvatica TaxID=28930 RepID=A0A2N9F8Y4_FAGSY
MEEPLELDTIVEVREELMVSSSGGNPTLRIAHFLKPTITSIEGPVFKLPPPILEPQKLSLRVSFRGWRCAQNNWKTWVDKMASLHQATWKRAARGRKIALAPAVLASIYKDLSLLKEKIVDSHKSEADNDDDDDDDDEDGGLALDSAGESFQWRPYAMGDCNFPKFYAEKEMFVSVGPGLDEELQSFARCLRVSELVGLGCIEQYLPHRVAMQFGLDQDLPGCVDRLNETSEIAWNHYSKPKHNMKLYVPSRLFEADVTVKYLEWWKQSIRSQQDASKGAVLQQREPRDSKGKEGTNKDYIPAKSSKKPHKKSKGKRKANDLHVTPGFSSKFNRMGMGNCNEEDGLTIAERMKFTDKHKNFVNGQGPQGGEAVNSFCQFEILSSSSSSSSSSDNGPVINLGKKDVAKGVTECQGDSNISKQSSKTSKGRMIDNTASIPPSFPPKCKIVEVGDSDEEDELTVKELLRSCNITNGVGNKMSGNGKPLSGAKSHDLSSSTADNGEVRKIESLVEPVGNIMQGEVVIGNAEGSMEDANASKEGSEAFTMESINGFEGARSSSSTFEIPGLELEARISKLEKVVAKLKAARFGNKFEKNPTKEGLSGL